MTHPFKVGGLGEIAIRCKDHDGMVSFYRDVLGLDVLYDGRGSTQIVFFRLPGGVAGHTSVLALFHADVGNTPGNGRPGDKVVAGQNASLHHIALSLPFEEQEKALAFYMAKGINHSIQIFDWIGWRGLFTTDPDGNTVELVAYHEDYLAR